MSTICVNCKCEIHGQAYDSESWVGSWCSATCKEAFDDMREEAYARKKGDLPEEERTMHKIIEAANTLDGNWALTIQWPDGTETVEIVSDNAAAILGYKPEGEE